MWVIPTSGHDRRDRDSTIAGVTSWSPARRMSRRRDPGGALDTRSAPTASHRDRAHRLQLPRMAVNDLEAGSCLEIH